MSEVALHCILERVKPGGRPSCFKLYACRGTGPDCHGSLRRSRHCSQCVEAKPAETLEALYERVQGGSA